MLEDLGVDAEAVVGERPGGPAGLLGLPEGEAVRGVVSGTIDARGQRFDPVAALAHERVEVLVAQLGGAGVAVGLLVEQPLPEQAGLVGGRILLEAA